MDTSLTVINKNSSYFGASAKYNTVQWFGHILYMCAQTHINAHLHRLPII